MSGPGAQGEQIGMAVKRLRKQRNLTQEALAELIDCSRSLIQQIESGTRIPPLAQREKLSGALGERLPGVGDEDGAEAIGSELRIRFNMLAARDPALATRALDFAESLGVLAAIPAALTPLRDIAERQLVRAEEVLTQIPSGSIVVREWNTVTDWLTVLGQAVGSICAIHTADLSAIGGDVGDEYHNEILNKVAAGVSVQRVYVLDRIENIQPYEDKMWQQVRAGVTTMLIKREFAPNAQSMLIVDDSFVISGDYDFRRRERDSSRFSSLRHDVQTAHRKFAQLSGLESAGMALIVNDLVTRSGLGHFERLDQGDCRTRFRSELEQAWHHGEAPAEGDRG